MFYINRWLYITIFFKLYRWDQTDLTKFLFASNKITAIPEEISCFLALEVLDGHDNLISKIDPSIGLLKKLRSLVLDHNNLSQLPRELCLLESLVLLRVSHNNLTSLFEEIDILDTLEELVSSAIFCEA